MSRNIIVSQINPCTGIFNVRKTFRSDSYTSHSQKCIFFGLVSCDMNIPLVNHTTNHYDMLLYKSYCDLHCQSCRIFPCVERMVSWSNKIHHLYVQLSALDGISLRTNDVLWTKGNKLHTCTWVCPVPCHACRALHFAEGYNIHTGLHVDKIPLSVMYILCDCRKIEWASQNKQTIIEL